MFKLAGRKTSNSARSKKLGDTPVQKKVDGGWVTEILAGKRDSVLCQAGTEALR